DGGVRAGSGCGSGAGADIGRLADGRVLVAVGVLHQHSCRYIRGVHDLQVRAGSGLHQTGKARQTGWRGAWTVGGVAGMPADHSRQGTGRRLVRSDVDPVDVPGAGGWVRAVPDSRVPAQAAPGRFAGVSAPEFCVGVCADWIVWRGDLRAGDAAAAVLSGTDGVYSTGCGVGRKPAWGRSDPGDADHWISDGEDRQPLADHVRIRDVWYLGVVVWRSEPGDRTMDIFVGDRDQRVRIGMRVRSAIDDSDGVFEE